MHAALFNDQRVAYFFAKRVLVDQRQIAPEDGGRQGCLNQPGKLDRHPDLGGDGKGDIFSTVHQALVYLH